MRIKIPIVGPCRDGIGEMYHACDKCYGDTEAYEATEITVPFWIGFWWFLGWIPKEYLQRDCMDEKYSAIYMTLEEYEVHLKMKSLVQRS